MARRKVLLLALAILAVSSGLILSTRPSTSLLAAGTYTASDLSTLSGGSTSQASGINTAGAVVGWSTDGSGVQHAVIWTSGTSASITDLGTNCQATAVNAGGAVVGWCTVGSAQHATEWTTGTAASKTDLGTLGGTSSIAYGVNTAGTVVGWADAASGVQHAFSRATGGPMLDLNPAGGTCAGSILEIATGINNTGAGQAVGMGYNSTANALFGFAMTLGSPATCTNLGTLGGTNSYATGVNDAGQVVGWANTSATSSGPSHAFLWSAGTMTDLGTLGGSTSSAAAVNATPQVVGASSLGGGAQQAFNWLGGAISALPCLTGGAACAAAAINSGGTIAGWSDTSGGNQHAVIWCTSPCGPPPPPCTGSVACPTVTGVNPSSGPTTGGTNVTVTGTSFSTTAGGTTIAFGANAATSVSCSSATQCTATSPAGAAGTVDVTATVAGQTSPTSAADKFTYVAPIICSGATCPTVSGVSPSSGPTAGGTNVTITGTNFSTAGGGTTIAFGSNPATNVNCSSTSTCSAISPPGSAGVVDVRVTTSVGTSATSAADQFTYVAPPAVTSVVPNSGPTLGGTFVTITGTNFSATASTVKFGTAVATSVNCSSTTQCTATSPAGTGTVDVTVTVNGVQSAATSGDQFTYLGTPTVTAVSPKLGPTTGGTVVTVTGTNFSTVSGTTTINFGATPGTNVTCTATTSCTVTNPAEAAGTVDVLVTTPEGTSAVATGGCAAGTTPCDQFTFVAAPTVTAVNPTSGPTTGGTLVTITGTNFLIASGATSVSFGTVAATNVSCTSTTQCTAVSPAEAAGIVDVRVATSGGVSATSAADQFTYVATAGSCTTTTVPTNVVGLCVQITPTVLTALGPAPGVTACTTPADCDTVTVTIQAMGSASTPIGAWAMDLMYDYSTVFCSPGTPGCTTPTCLSGSGSVCNPSYQPSPGVYQVRVDGDSSAGLTAAPSTLATITLNAIGSGAPTCGTALKIKVGDFEDTSGAPMGFSLFSSVTSPGPVVSGSSISSTITVLPLGDVNADCDVTPSDALCILRDVATLATTPACPSYFPTGVVADVNQDGSVNAVDSLCILRGIAGLGTSVNCPYTIVGVFPPLAGAMPNVASSSGSAAGGKVGVSPATASISTGGSTTVKVQGSGLSGTIGAWAVDVHYDPSVVKVTGCKPVAGSVCNTTYRSGVVRITGASASGVAADASLASITFKAIGKSGSSSALHVSVGTLGDANGAPIAAAGSDGTIHVGRAAPSGRP